MKKTTPTLFDERRTAQAAAFFLFKAGGELEILKLMKLLYLAERLSLARYCVAITGDSLVSMPHGPVLSETLEHIHGLSESVRGGWTAWISDRENNVVSLKKNITSTNDLGELSESDAEILAETWDNFGKFSASGLRNYTHKKTNCPEWRDPHGSSLPITYEDLFLALGFSKDDAKRRAEYLSEQAEINAALA